jgi:hypothetical protein
MAAVHGTPCTIQPPNSNSKRSGWFNCFLARTKNSFPIGPKDQETLSSTILKSTVISNFRYHWQHGHGELPSYMPKYKSYLNVSSKIHRPLPGWTREPRVQWQEQEPEADTTLIYVVREQLPPLFSKYKVTLLSKVTVLVRGLIYRFLAGPWRDN